MRHASVLRLALSAAAAAGLLLAAAGAAPAQDAKGATVPVPLRDPKLPPAASDEAARMALTRFDQDFRATDTGRKINAIAALARTKNDLVARRLAGVLATHPDPEVRGAAAMVLPDMNHDPRLAGDLLGQVLASGKENESSVLMRLADGMAKLAYGDGIPALGELCLKTSDWQLRIAILKAFGRMKDRRALLPILDLWLMEPHGYSWEGGEVHVDTGASGDTDQKEAERQYKQKYGNQHKQGAPPMMVKAYLQALVEAAYSITGVKFEKCIDLCRWMVDHEKELGYPLPGKTRSAIKQRDEEEKAAQEKKAKEKK